MSQHINSDSFTPPLHPVQPSAFVSPLTTLANQPASSSPAASLSSNKIIPPDYLNFRTRPSATATARSAQGSPLVPSSRDSPVKSLYEGSLGSDAGEKVQPRSISRQDSQTDASDKENASVDEDLKLARTISPDSIASTAFSGESSINSVRPAPAVGLRSLPINMPRTSSIDSAISSVSASSVQHRGNQDTRDLSPASVQGLIAAAGTPENLIVHLMKEKTQATNQNSQLWKLVEKQRALLLGLNKDLERITKDRDRYKKKLKEVVANAGHQRMTTQSPHPEKGHAQPVQVPQPLQYSAHTEGPKRNVESEETHHDAPGPAIVVEREATQDSSSKRPALQANTLGLPQPTFSLTEATPLSEKSTKGFSASRKVAPKPLNLVQSNVDKGQNAINKNDRGRRESDGDGEVEPRGRRKTREEDDRDREKALILEQQARSRSMKESKTAQASSGEERSTVLAAPPPLMSLPASPRPPQGLMAANAAPQANSMLASPALRSPGLPSSPRPMANMGFGIPLSPRANATPLSPRAPKQPLPAPLSPAPFGQQTLIQPQNAMARNGQPADRLQVHDPTPSNEIPPVYRGLISPAYPNLMLPPNALPSVQIKVASSRLRPSRHSMLGLKTQEDSTVFSLSVFSRASRNELWRVEKIPSSLTQLEQQLKQYCRDLPRLPDRKLFVGHSPALIDARRAAVDNYFEELLDIELDEKSAQLICKYLSDDLLNPEEKPTKYPGVNEESLPQTTSLSGKIVKTGFLTKRGKNFGGWKSRYFVLDSPDLRYFETPGGPHLGTIKVQHARIGSQRPDDSANNDADDQYRHAFLIQEPKKKDATTYVRHVLCAESDAERDEWVQALLHYTDDGLPRGSQESIPFNAPLSKQSTNQRQILTKESPTSTPTSPTVSSHTDSPVHDGPARNNHISRPVNGAPISDSAQWGNKSTQPAAVREKEKSKMPNIFHFRKSSHEQLGQQKQSPPKPRILRHNGYVRPVFGLPLTEAVEYCGPFDVEVDLPAVVYRSIEYLRFRKALNEEGLFRLSGSNILIKALRERFNTEGDFDIVNDEEYYDVHAIASLLKQYLRELPSPILTRDLHIEFLRVLDLESQDEKILAFNVLVHRLPPANFALLRALSEYLLEVTDNAARNKMSARNIGIVFSPTLNIPTPVFNLFLSAFDFIFDHNPSSFGSDQSQIRSTEVTIPASQDLSSDEVRSPRHQVLSEIPTPAIEQSGFDPKNGSSEHRSKGHHAQSSSELGFTPLLQPSYETGHYVSHPQHRVHQEMPRYTAVAPQQMDEDEGRFQIREGEQAYGSLNHMLVPGNAASTKAKRRESAMLF